MLSKATRPPSSMFKAQPKIAYQQPSFGSSSSFAVPSSRALQDNMDQSLYCKQRLFGSFHSYPYLAGYKRNAAAQGDVNTNVKPKVQRERRNAAGIGSLLLTSMVNIKNERKLVYFELKFQHKNEVKDELEKCKDSGEIQKIITLKFGQCDEMLKKLTLSYQQLGSNLDRIEGAVVEQFNVIASHMETNKEKIQSTQEAMSNHIIQQHHRTYKKLDKCGNGVKSFVQSRSKSQPRGGSKVTYNVRRNVTISKKQVSFVQTKIVAGSVKRSKSAAAPVTTRNNNAQKKSLKRKSDEVVNQEKSEFDPKPQLKKVKLAVESNGKGEESGKMMTKSFVNTHSKKCSVKKPLVASTSTAKRVTFSK